jgi:hypothetical protein
MTPLIIIGVIILLGLIIYFFVLPVLKKQANTTKTENQVGGFIFKNNY